MAELGLVITTQQNKNHAVLMKQSSYICVLLQNSVCWRTGLNSSKIILFKTPITDISFTSIMKRENAIQY